MNLCAFISIVISGLFAQDVASHKSHGLIVSWNKAETNPDWVNRIELSTIQKYKENGFCLDRVDETEVDKAISLNCPGMKNALRSMRMLQYARLRNANVIVGLDPCLQGETTKRCLLAWVLNRSRASSSLGGMVCDATKNETIVFWDSYVASWGRRDRYSFPTSFVGAGVPREDSTVEAGHRGFLGIRCEPIPGALQSELRILEVLPDTAASISDLRPGQVITAINGKKATRDNLVDLVEGHRDGTIKLTLKDTGGETKKIVRIGRGDEYLDNRRRKNFQQLVNVPIGISPTGKEVRMSDLRGKLVLLYCHASWCGPCKRHIPVIEMCRDKYSAGGFEVVYLSSDSDRKKWLDYVGCNQLSGIQCLSNNALGRALEVSFIPFGAMISPSGIFMGEANLDTLSLIIGNEMAGPNGPLRAG